MKKNMAKNMERGFMQSLYRDVAPVPAFLLAHYAELGLSDAEMLDLARLFACLEQGSNRLSAALLQNRFAGRENELAAFLVSMQAKGLAEQDELGAYSIDGLYQQLLELWVFTNSVPAGQKRGEQAAQADEAKNSEAIKKVYAMFEAEFARPLSPLELQKLNAWLITDGWSAAMLAEAVSRAVIHGAFSLAYIDKILLRWRREGITAPEQLAAEDAEPEQKRRANKRRGRAAQSAEPSFSDDTDYSKYI